MSIQFSFNFPICFQVTTQLEEIVGELLDQQERGPDVLGETLIAAGPERLDSFQSSFLNQGGKFSGTCRRCDLSKAMIRCCDYASV